MGFARAEIDIAKPPDEVWAVAGDFGALADWMPGVESCVEDGDDRILKMLGMTVTERLESRDPEARSIVYAIVGGVPVGNHRATITVSETAAGSHVTWDVEVEPDEMTDLMHQTYQGALQALGKHLGG
ncbi:MAG TPA: SRPBCC family protein [Acidimicrobiales bacterium]|nr:SRPBCC family protein [Acidimicrobiales bacterium]